jgi:hypothetical protein
MSIKYLRWCNNVQTYPFVIYQKLGNMNPLALWNISTSMFWSFEMSIHLHANIELFNLMLKLLDFKYVYFGVLNHFSQCLIILMH